MTIQQLRYIVALDTHRHFVKAAESCYVAQPTLTLQVKKLESQLDFVIFDRSSQPLKPTSLGAIFITKARQILRELEQLEQLIQDDKTQIEGVFRIGIIPSLAPYLLPLFLDDFLTRNRNTNLEIKEMQSAELIEALIQDKLDIGILVTPLNETLLREIPLFYEPFMVFAREGHAILKKTPINPQQLKTGDLWLVEQGHCFRNQILNICTNDALYSKNRNLKFEGGSFETLKRMIRKMGGYTLIPELAFNPSTEEACTCRFADPQPAREVSLVVHKGFTKERLLVEMRKSILEHTPDRFQKNERFIKVKWR